jgi:formate-dependent nitrite reductase cytochrome c552 subunit
MADPQKQPIIVLLTSHWITMAGVALVTLAGFSWLFVLPANLRGNVGNPYIGLLVFIAIPILFFAGLALIPIGIALGRRSAAAGFVAAPERRAVWRRAGIFFAIMTLANVVIGSQLTYRAVEHMETVQFCGQSCHVMKPEFTAHLLAPHQAVACVECHVAPGASGWVQSKITGTRQLRDVVLNAYSRPIESAMESNRLVPSADTCEQCHAREKFIGPRLYLHSEFKDDAANTRMETVLMMRVGGGSLGGIHGAHMGPGVRIRYAAADKKRQTIPWVEYGNSTSNVTTTYLASGTKADAVSTLPIFEMQCVDCHNRAAHSFELPEHAVDRALATGQISADLPFVKKTAIQLLKAAYASQDEAAQKIPAALGAFYQQEYADVWAKRSNDIQLAGQALVGIYRSNVFPDLKVTWGTYPNNLGHMDDPGCFRCHDDSHANADKKTIPQDCGTCHEMLATEETSPAVLKTLGLVDSGISALKQ